VAFSFVFPTIVSLPLGYDATVIAPIGQIAQRLVSKDAEVVVRANLCADGEVTALPDARYRFEDGKLAGDDPDPWVFRDRLEEGAKNPGYLEIEAVSADESKIFSSKRVFGLYTCFGKDGKASFFSDNAYKYGAPPVINQMARFRRYVDTYPVINIDRTRDMGESLALLNPYQKPIVAQIRTSDGRKLKKTRIAAQSALNINLSDLLQDGEDKWAGQVQLTANNRLITFTFKHRFDDQAWITDYEHLDPFRDDPTHLPFAQKLRQDIGEVLVAWRGGRTR